MNENELMSSHFGRNHLLFSCFRPDFFIFVGYWLHPYNAFAHSLLNLHWSSIKMGESLSFSLHFTHFFLFIPPARFHLRNTRAPLHLHSLPGEN